MSELMLEILRTISRDVADIKATQSEHTRRLGRIEQALAQRGVDDADAGVRFDRLVERVEQIERRLELRD
ncbi:hypothetical protein [Reyranella sp.]|uniref:hypothetical protein n=1 Tax=Reyranella sp. TaxID=1929291 RepID=UPI00378439E3